MGRYWSSFLIERTERSHSVARTFIRRFDAEPIGVGQVMTGNPVTVKPDDRLEGCMAMMAARGFRHLPVLDAGKVVGVISIGDVVKDIIRDLEHNVGDLMGYIMRDGPGG